MKQSLQLKLSQSLTMTPQLQQAIKLLQLSSLDLEAEIQEALESNPLLEVDSSQESAASDDKNNPSESSKESTAREDKDTTESLKNDTIDTDMVADTQWEDWGYVSQGGGSKPDENNQFEYQGETSESLRDQLVWQVNMTKLSETDRGIAMILIDSIDDSGFMKANISDVVEMLQDNSEALEDTPLDEESAIQEEEVEAVLHFIQSFEPAGIAARSLQECLLIQLKRLPDESQEIELAKQVVTSQFDFLANRNYRQVMKNLKLNETQLKGALEVIQTLDPRPGNQLSQNSAQYIKPDVYVRKNKSG